MTKDDETKIREIVRIAIEKEIKKDRDSISSLKKDVDALDKKTLNKQQIKDLMVKAFVRQHRFMWEKSKFLTSYFNEL